MFKAIRDKIHKSQAASVIRVLLEDQTRGGLTNVKPDDHAHSLIAAAWDRYSDHMTGTGRSRSSKFSFAGFALAMALKDQPINPSSHLALLGALGQLLTGLDNNEISDQFNAADLSLLHQVSGIYIQSAEEVDACMTAEMMD